MTITDEQSTNEERPTVLGGGRSSRSLFGRANSNRMLSTDLESAGGNRAAPSPLSNMVLMENPSALDNDCNNNEGGGDDDDMTVILLDHTANDLDEGDNAFVDHDSPEMQERRRNVLLRELRRVQRASFIHFLILCLIPTSLLLIVITTVLSEDESCESEATTCTREERTFINAFTTRCVCDAITLATNP
eukprot:CAMPEP_0198117636 /NCGR_PEP_ID=MMETSP1442-20131203/18746_1 /TAXON_ID= /ORGANISM="Craspedostauros australis, Strain CCMP3328" /LENGTH=189 /DNA_ID=CAMNT_0043775729 /DNA_START=46 /DNA_END=615 /DNA_ORIENTATION=-